ncbi:MAG: 4-hydroxyphenylacetate 3-hydroxylase N-terminal domain-containing protein [Alphaproteobacteria bacterium]|nr:4-hydroxyphenylacetate 3-hydroxylase N-terminal domain-containing protein [Alphaproteobacteria bacterium]
MGARTGAEYIKGLQDGRRIHVNGELVRDVTQYHGFRGVVGELARHYDRHHDAELRDALTFASPKDGARVSNSFLAGTDRALMEARVAGDRARSQFTYGLMGRLPDFMNAWVTDMAMVPHVLGAKDKKFADNASAYYAHCRDNDVAMTHTLVDPQIDRTKGPDAQASMRIVKETSAGIIVNGARMLSTLAPVSDELLVGPFMPRKPGEEAYCAAFAVPVAAEGLRFVARETYDQGRSRFDRPLSGRFDEGDAIAFFDNVLIPWERVFVAGDIRAYNALIVAFPGHVGLQAVIRGTEKLRFMTGLACKLATVSGRDKMPRYQEMLGELVGYVQIAEGMITAAANETLRRIEATKEFTGGTADYSQTFEVARGVHPFHSFVGGAAMRQFFPMVNTQVCDVIRRIGSSGFVMTPTEGDFDNAEITASLENVLAGPGMEARKKVQLQKLAWDAVATEFGSRQEHYEIFFSGDPYAVRIQQFGAPERGRCEALVDRLLGEGA